MSLDTRRRVIIRAAARAFLIGSVILAVALGSLPGALAQTGFDRLHQSQTPLTPEEIVSSQIEQLSLEDLDTFVRALDPNVREALPPLDLKRMIFEGEGVEWGALGARIARVFLDEVSLNLSLLGQLIVLGVFCALLKTIASSTRSSEVAGVAVLVSLLALLYLALSAFRSVVATASDTLDQMVGFMLALLPVLSTMLAAVGAVSTAAIFHPLLYATVTGIAALVQNVLFPLVYISAALAVIGSLSKEFPVKQFSGLLRSGTVLILGFAFVAFFAVVQARGAIAPIADGLAMRTAKLLTGAFIPVVGGRIADALDVIVGGSVLIKNAIGVFGMGAIVVITAFPIAKIFSILTIFRLATALVEPIADERLVQAMAGLSGSLTLLLAGMITAALMFFVGITVVVGVGNATAFIR